MEYNPSLTPAYLAGKVDEYVKFQARDTVMRNVKRDRRARYARIPDGTACDFCRMLGSRGFVYHSEESAGGVLHGTKMDQYHPYCNCQIAVCFDPYIEKYDVVSESGSITTVTRGHGDGAVTVTGRDKSDRLRRVDFDELFAEYKAMGEKFKAKSKLKDYTHGSRLTDEKFDEAMKALSDARTLDELHEVGKRIVEEWPPNQNGRNASQWNEMSRLAKELEESLRQKGSQLLRMTGTENQPAYRSETEMIEGWIGFGRLAPIREASLDVSNKTRARLQSVEDLRFLRPAAQLAIDHGYITYTKPLSAFEGADDERRDIFAHTTLASHGYRIEVLPEAKGGRNIDLLIGDDYWEIKSPDADGISSKDPTKFVQNNIESAYDQFKGHREAHKEETRIVFNCRYTPVSDEEIADRIEFEMDKRPDIKEVMMITKTGDIVHFAR